MGIFNFFKHIADSSIQTNSPSITTVTGSRTISGIKNLNKVTLLELQKLCIPGTKKLSLDADRIVATCDSILSQHNFVLDDCKDLISKTDNPKTFFSRYDLLIETLQEMVKFQPYVQMYGYQPEESLDYYLGRKEYYTNKLIDRRYNKALIKADSLKTEKGKKNQFIKAYEELCSFSDLLSPTNLTHLENKFKNKL